MANCTKKEILETEQRRIFKTKDNIEILKNNIKKVIRNYWIEQQNIKELTEEEQEDLKRLYSTVIAKLNEMFYGYNVTITKEVLREQGIKIPKEGIIGIMNLDHLHYYEAMLYKCFVALKDNDSLNNDSFIKIAADIGLRANQYFQEQYNDYPIDNLIKVALIEQESKNEKSELKKEIKRLKSEIRELKQTIKILEKENYYGKENNSARIRNKRS